MKHPLWFRASCMGRVPVHWTPCAWQGWALVVAYVVALTGIMVKVAPGSPAKAIAIALALIAALIAAAAATDDRHAPAP